MLGAILHAPHAIRSEDLAAQVKPEKTVTEHIAEGYKAMDERRGHQVPLDALISDGGR